MTFWLIGDEEPENPRFIAAGPGACGVYFMAGAHCMRQTRYRPEDEIPEEWFVSDQWVRGWPNGARLAARLVKNGLWIRTLGGYSFDWIQDRNKAEAVRVRREKERAKKRGRRADSPGDIYGGIGGRSRPPAERSRSFRESRDAS